MRPASLIALYHAVGAPEATGYRDALPAEALERQLHWLRRRYRVLPLAELLERRRQGRPLAGLAALTFDDNHRSVLETALPLAATLGLPATWFLIAGPLRGRPFWRDLVRRVEAAGRVAEFLAFAAERGLEVGRLRPARFYRDSKDPARVGVARLAALLEQFLPAGPPADFVTLPALGAPPPGIALASHGASHLPFASLPAEGQAEEIRQGRAALAATGWPALDALALPFGDPGTYDATTLAVAGAAGLRGLLLTATDPAGAEDLSDHPLATAARLPILVRDLPGRWPAARFD